MALNHENFSHETSSHELIYEMNFSFLSEARRRDKAVQPRASNLHVLVHLRCVVINNSACSFANCIATTVTSCGANLSHSQVVSTYTGANNL